ncbi:MAG: DMT family transporter [Chloroflexota bacterium]|nr:DMT family transporter [Chloroflexota bacterium]
MFCSVLAFLLYARGLRGLDAGTAVGLMNLVPVFGLVLALLVLREPVQLVQAVGRSRRDHRRGHERPAGVSGGQ